ncbi:YezD family protein [Bacillus methanolicus]|uniref:DUF2292 domain-containing protein n=1 Tax=Bacillus methanolicus (strain MGA3 / ATCC 53907) TaxID=796606 RepID=I3E8X3_BACMM|nr:YezD family protein [Bacillus methanolicus]AIE60208.1 hypothetical protein BMMGA3_09040 [Bacillus methanolicus MGA3]EIJ82944.1 hypothetical protein MGA3_06950 [Bacillus methanolicus MGA3]
MKQLDEEKIKYILSKLDKLEYGCIVITVHDSDITQIDITEKKRFPLVKNRKLEAKK